VTRAYVAEARIPAPPSAVWHVLEDFASYPKWNPFTEQVDCSKTIGEPVRMRVAFRPWLKQWQEETLLVWEPQRAIHYALDQMPRWLIWARREQTLHADGDGTRYHTVDYIGGALSPIVHLVYGRMIQAGFENMAAALRRRVLASLPAD